MKLTIISAIAICLVNSAAAQMDIGMQFVEVGDPGNPADPLTGGTIGSVSYAFQMGKYEVTNREYVQFLNSVDPFGSNLLKLYETGMSGSYGGITLDLARPYAQKFATIANRAEFPVTYLTYPSAMRFVNWLHGGDTESGAYTLSTRQRNPDARFWIPNRDEWHKAAYYHGPNSPLQAVYGTDYSLYPMGGFSANSSAPPGSASSANFNSAVGNFVQVGSYPQALSHYGTADQGGNAEEWYDDGVSSSFKSWLGGNFQSSATYLSASLGSVSSSSTGGALHRGFRVAGLSISQPAPVVPNVEAHTAVEIRWLSQVGVRYQIQGSESMTSWVDIGIPLIGNGSTMSSLQAIRSNRKFFRLVVIP